MFEWPILDQNFNFLIPQMNFEIMYFSIFQNIPVTGMFVLCRVSYFSVKSELGQLGEHYANWQQSKSHPFDKVSVSKLDYGTREKILLANKRRPKYLSKTISLGCTFNFLIWVGLLLIWSSTGVLAFNTSGIFLWYSRVVNNLCVWSQYIQILFIFFLIHIHNKPISK